MGKISFGERLGVRRIDSSAIISVKPSSSWRLDGGDTGERGSALSFLFGVCGRFTCGGAERVVVGTVCGGMDVMEGVRFMEAGVRVMLQSKVRGGEHGVGRLGEGGVGDVGGGEEDVGDAVIGDGRGGGNAGSEMRSKSSSSGPGEVDGGDAGEVVLREWFVGVGLGFVGGELDVG